MDNHMMVSMMNSQKVGAEKPRTHENAADGDLFSKIMDEQTQGGNVKKGSEKEKELVSGKEPKKGDSKELRDMDDKFRERMGIKPGQMTGNKNILFNLALKDPSTMSLAQKQSLHMGQYGQGVLGLKDFQNVLQQRGVNLKDLSFTQMAQLGSRQSTDQIHSFLDELGMSKEEKPAEGVDSAAPGGKKSLAGVGSQANQTTNTGAQDITSAAVQHAKATEQTQDARKLQREEVIKQIITHIDVQTVANKTEIAIKLNPEFLGDLKVNLTMDHAGGKEISADFETTSKETKALLDESMDDLKDAFALKGMNLNSTRTKLVEAVS